jgi:hypothetical protein
MFFSTVRSTVFRVFFMAGVLTIVALSGCQLGALPLMNYK